jgi:2-C-methyl-D-erythritol 4-phosphate cytidylyltransferase
MNYKNRLLGSNVTVTKAKIWALVPAAGSGQRMGASIPKQYLEIAGKTILEHTIALLNACSQIEKIILCTAADDNMWHSLDIDVMQVVGGETRAQSVFNGLAALAKIASPDDWVLVHDAARPCLSAEDLLGFIEQLKGQSIGGILAMPCKDTLKYATEEGEPKISKTLDRSMIWQAQTPQMFRHGLLLAALREAIDKNAPITDEASAMEFHGHAVSLIVGDSRNIKITTAQDFALAQFLLDS